MGGVAKNVSSGQRLYLPSLHVKNQFQRVSICQPRKKQGNMRLEVVTWRLYCANRAHHLQLPLCRPPSSGSHQAQAPQLSCVISQRSACTERQQGSLCLVSKHRGCSSGREIVLARGSYPALSCPIIIGPVKTKSASRPCAGNQAVRTSPRTGRHQDQMFPGEIRRETSGQQQDED